jgi:hypothetical protein
MTEPLPVVLRAPRFFEFPDAATAEAFARGLTATGVDGVQRCIAYDAGATTTFSGPLVITNAIVGVISPQLSDGCTLRVPSFPR